MTTAAERLRLARAQAGFVQAVDAVRHFGWKLAAYKQHEAGVRLFPLERAEEYAKAYGVTTNWLFLGVGSVRPAPAGELPERIAALVETLSEDDQRRVLAYIESFHTSVSGVPDDIADAPEGSRKRYKTRSDKGSTKPKKAKAA